MSKPEVVTGTFCGLVDYWASSQNGAFPKLRALTDPAHNSHTLNYDPPVFMRVSDIIRVIGRQS